MVVRDFAMMHKRKERCRKVPAVVDELPVASELVVAAGSAFAAAAVPVAAASPAQTHAALEQRERCSACLGPPMAAARSSGALLVGTVGPAVEPRASHRASDTAMVKCHDHAGDRCVAEHARQGCQADAHGGRTGSG